MKQDAAYNEINPTQKFKGVGSLEEFKTKSTHARGANNIKAPGKQMASAVRGTYLRLIISVITPFDNLMTIVFDKRSCQAVGMLPRLIETCFFIILTAGPVLLAGCPF